jgi:hypothetical protein
MTKLGLMPSASDATCMPLPFASSLGVVGSESDAPPQSPMLKNSKSGASLPWKSLTTASALAVPQPPSTTAATVVSRMALVRDLQ